MKKVFFAVILLAVISFNSCAKKITKPIDVQAELTNKNEHSTIVNKQDEIVCSTIIATTYTIKEYNEAIDKIKLENEKEQLRISKLSGDELHNEFRKCLMESTVTVNISIEVYFSPYDDCEKQWIETITKASSYVYVSCFGITNANITKALCDKSKAGIKVILCTDKMQSGNKTAKIREQELKIAGAEYVIKKKQVLEHNKMIVVDDRYAIIGSWNLSGNAQPQDNSITVFDYPYIACKVRNAIERIYNRDNVK